jgi:hypothetical protein
MTQRDKELLLKDLCGRLPYEIILVSPNERTTYQTDGNTAAELLVEEGWKPYLRPLYSMTREEKKEFERLIDEKLNRNTGQEDNEWTPWVLHYTTGIRNSIGGEKFYFDEMIFIYDWLNKNHFDYRDLIPKGLAIKVTKDNNPYKV